MKRDINYYKQGNLGYQIAQAFRYDSGLFRWAVNSGLLNPDNRKNQDMKSALLLKLLGFEPKQVKVMEDTLDEDGYQSFHFEYVLEGVDNYVSRMVAECDDVDELIELFKEELGEEEIEGLISKDKKFFGLK